MHRFRRFHPASLAHVLDQHPGTTELPTQIWTVLLPFPLTGVVSVKAEVSRDPDIPTKIAGRTPV